MHGKGVSVQTNGDMYEGDWRDNQRHGIGTYNWNDGDRYIG